MNYYDYLGLDQQAGTQDIQASLIEMGRLWQKRLNAPDIKKRQEAELKLGKIVEAKAIFKDENSRLDYDASLIAPEENDANIGDDHRKDKEELIALINQMGDVSEMGNVAEALLLAKEAMFKYPKSFTVRSSASSFLSFLNRMDEALNMLKELETWPLNDLERLYLYKDILNIVFINYHDLNLSEKYFKLGLPLADSIADNYRSAEAILTWSVEYYVKINNYDAAIERFDLLTERINDLDPSAYHWILEAIKLKCESLYQKNEKGEFIVTNLDQIKEIETLLKKASALKAAKPDYDGRWIDARLSYLNLAVKEKSKSSQTLVSTFLFIFSAMFLMRALSGAILTPYSFILIALIAYCLKYVMTNNEPIYIKNRKNIKIGG